MKVEAGERAGAGAARRPYRMKARAAAVAATGERILDAAVAIFWEAPAERVSLEQVSERAGVSVQTVIRRFGGRDGLFAATAEREVERVRAQRDEAPADDARGAVRVLIDHYEELGDRVLALLAAEGASPQVGAVVETGRQAHRDWCERVFAAALAGRRGAERERRLAQLVAVCDVWTWRLLRRDSGLSRAETETALVELLEPLMT
jgi:AcrR family transcriptional regulator